MESFLSSNSMVTSSIHLKRRKFVKTIILGAATSGLCGSKWFGHFAGEASAADIPFPIGQFTFHVSDFPPLADVLGSISLQVPGIPDILVTRLGPNEFAAVTSVCTHQGCSVAPYSAEYGGMRCPCHRSLYNPDGSVISGPAPLPLYRFKLAFDGNDSITLELVKFSYLVSASPIPLTKHGRKRLSISFQTERSNNYAVMFKSSASDVDWTQIPFSQTVDGNAVDQFFFGTGGPIVLYVDINQSAGIFAVARYHLLGG